MPRAPTRSRSRRPRHAYAESRDKFATNPRAGENARGNPGKELCGSRSFPYSSAPTTPIVFKGGLRTNHTHHPPLRPFVQAPWQCPPRVPMARPCSRLPLRGYLISSLTHRVLRSGAKGGATVA
jgi:hypothetical protein